MARFSRFRRSFSRRARTIVRYVKTRRRYRPRGMSKNTKMLFGLGILAVAGFIYKDKIKSMLAK